MVRGVQGKMSLGICFASYPHRIRLGFVSSLSVGPLERLALCNDVDCRQEIEIEGQQDLDLWVMWVLDTA